MTCHIAAYDTFAHVQSTVKLRNEQFGEPRLKNESLFLRKLYTQNTVSTIIFRLFSTLLRVNYNFWFDFYFSYWTFSKQSLKTFVQLCNYDTFKKIDFD